MIFAHINGQILAYVKSFPHCFYKKKTPTLPVLTHLLSGTLFRINMIIKEKKVPLLKKGTILCNSTPGALFRYPFFLSVGRYPSIVWWVLET